MPPRAQYLRVIHCELNRIHSHLVWLGTSALDLGAISIFWYCFRERDKVLDLFEASAGQRMHTRYIQVGGVFEDIPVGWDRKVLAFVEDMEERLGQYEAILDRNEIFLQRTKGVGIVPPERLLELGVTGPLLRAAGDPGTSARPTPYCSYEHFDFKIPIGTVGDCYDRYRVRVAEIRESCAILRQARRRPAGGALHHRQPQGRAAAAARARDLDGGADPPLQARHRGLPRPARRGLRADRGPARRATAASWSRTVPRSRRACTCAIRRS